MIEKPLQWHFSMKHEHSLVICRSLFNTNLKEKNRNNNSKATTSRNNLTATQQQEAINKKKEQATQ